MNNFYVEFPCSVSTAGIYIRENLFDRTQSKNYICSFCCSAAHRCELHGRQTANFQFPLKIHASQIRDSHPSIGAISAPAFAGTLIIRGSCCWEKVLMRLMHNARLFAQPCKPREIRRPNAFAARTESTTELTAHTHVHSR
jgi:hypothetical protein